MDIQELEKVIKQAKEEKWIKLLFFNDQLTNIPESIGQLTHLQKLNLSGNRLTSLPESIGQLSHLQELCLLGNRITNLPDSIGQLTNLQNLDISGNRLASLPESIGQLIYLQWLELTENNLTSLPESIGQLVNLDTLELENNQLTKLPESIGQLTNLQELSLSFNKLTNLPKSFDKLINLKALKLENNQLTKLPELIGQLIYLQWLGLSGNRLTDLSPLQALIQEDLMVVRFFDVDLPKRYWTKLSEWKPEWLLDEDNAEVRRVLIEQLGYEKIYDRLGSETIDNWREYTLLKIDNVEIVYDEDGVELDDREPMVLLKMTCPSTEHIHILRVPPEMESAEAAITWVNHGIHPDKFSIQT